MSAPSPFTRRSPPLIRSRVRLSLCLCLCLSLLATLAGCSDEPSKGPTASGPTQFPPDLPAPELRATIVMPAGSNETPRLARTLVRGQFQRVNLEFGRAAGLLRAFEAMPYESYSEREWLADTTGGYPECESVFHAQRIGDELVWRWLWNGTCGSTGRVSGWKLAELHTSPDGRTGVLDEFWAFGQPKSLRVEWSVGDGTSEWRLLSRETAIPALQGTFTQHHRSDGSTDCALSRVGDYRWQANISSDGYRGTFQLDRWDAPSFTWQPVEVIQWSNEHGSWTTHPLTGDPTERSW